MTKLSSRTGKYSNKAEYHDPEFQEGLDVNSDGYDNNTELTRTYDVRSFDGIFVDLENNGASGLDFEIYYASKNFEKLQDLQDEDFVEDTAETTIAAGASFSKEYIRVTPKITAIQIQMKRTTAGADTRVNGVFSLR